MAEVVPEPVRERVHAALLAAAGDHLVDPGGVSGPGCPRPARVAAARPGRAGTGAEVPVQAPGRRGGRS